LGSGNNNSNNNNNAAQCTQIRQCTLLLVLDETIIRNRSVSVLKS